MIGKEQVSGMRWCGRVGRDRGQRRGRYREFMRISVYVLRSGNKKIKEWIRGRKKRRNDWYVRRVMNNSLKFIAFVE